MPLFTAMVAFETAVLREIDTLTFPLYKRSEEGAAATATTTEGANGVQTLWFAARNNSKEGLQHLTTDCWTLVSTPSYAVSQIRQVPMQDAETGDFLPQEPTYLRETIADELIAAFLTAVRQREAGVETEIRVRYKHAQRWGSALPAPRHLATDQDSPTRAYLSGVAYDTGSSALGPTTIKTTTTTTAHGVSEVEVDTEGYCHYDAALCLIQIGDMICTSATPGLESAVISAARGAEVIKAFLR